MEKGRKTNARKHREPKQRVNGRAGKNEQGEEQSKERKGSYNRAGQSAKQETQDKVLEQCMGGERSLEKLG